MCGGFGDELASLSAQGSRRPGLKCSRALGRSLCSARNRIGARTIDLIDDVVSRCRPIRSKENGIGFRLPLLISGRKRTRATGHPLLGMHVPLAGRPGEHVWFGEISLERCPWIDDHRVQGVAVVAARSLRRDGHRCRRRSGLRATGDSHADQDRENAAAPASNRV